MFDGDKEERRKLVDSIATNFHRLISGKQGGDGCTQAHLGFRARFGQRGLKNRLSMGGA